MRFWRAPMPESSGPTSPPGISPTQVLARASASSASLGLVREDRSAALERCRRRGLAKRGQRVVLGLGGLVLLELRRSSGSGRRRRPRPSRAGPRGTLPAMSRSSQPGAASRAASPWIDRQRGDRALAARPSSPARAGPGRAGSRRRGRPAREHMEGLGPGPGPGQGGGAGRRRPGGDRPVGRGALRAAAGAVALVAIGGHRRQRAAASWMPAPPRPARGRGPDRLRRRGEDRRQPGPQGVRGRPGRSRTGSDARDP